MDQHDAGQLFDELVRKSQAACASGKATKASTAAKLRLQTTPVPILETTPRELGLVDPGLRQVFRELVNGESPWPLFLTGRAGRGKSAAALCLADHVPRSVYFRFPRLLKSFLWAKDGGTLVWWNDAADGQVRPKSQNCNEHELFAYLSKAPLLVLDDVATRSGYTDAQYDNFYEVLEERKFKATVVVSNLALDQMTRVFDDRITSRLARGTVFTLEGPDRRVEEPKVLADRAPLNGVMT